MIDHETIEERLAVRALGGMDPDERAVFDAEFAEHRESCETCRRLEAQTRDAAALLALAEAPVEPPAGLEDRIVAAATAATPGTVDAANVVPLRRRRGLPAIATAAAAAVLLVVASVAATLVVTRREDAPLRAVSLEFGGGQVAVAYEPGSDEAVVIGQGLPQPPGERVYQLWLRSDGEMIGSGTFRPEGGQVVTRTRLAAEEFDLVAVTEEPPGGSEQPTSEPLATAPV